jgi:hypothetical protein
MGVGSDAGKPLPQVSPKRIIPRAVGAVHVVAFERPNGCEAPRVPLTPLIGGPVFIGGHASAGILVPLELNVLMLEIRLGVTAVWAMLVFVLARAAVVITGEADAWDLGIFHRVTVPRRTPLVLKHVPMNPLYLVENAVQKCFNEIVSGELAPRSETCLHDRMLDRIVQF